MATLVLDPGHGGQTKIGGSSPNNATGPTGLLEKTATLAVARAAQRALEGSGLRVLLTRDTDRNLGIVDRARVARAARAEAFVSIHFNAAPSGGPPAQGTETWVGEGHTGISRRLAAEVQRSVLAVTGLRDRRVKVGDVSGVIKPANHDPHTANCLVEISFLDRQPEEERRLRDPGYIDALGAALAEAVTAHLRERGIAVADGVEASAEPEDAASAAMMGMVPRGDGEEAMPDGQSPPSERVSMAAVVAETPPAGGAPGGAVVIGWEDRPGVAIPFIDHRLDPRHPFSDLRGDSPVDDPARMLSGWREVRSEGSGLMVEAAVGRFLTVPAALVQLLAERRRAVARITAQGTDYRGIPQPGPWTGTGFLAGPNLLLTNHHVLNSPEVAQGAVVEFDFEVPAADLAEGLPAPPAARKLFRLDPRRLFVTSPVEGGLDYCFVWIDEAASATFGTVPMERASFTARFGEQAFVIHHPQGQPKQISVDDTDVVNILSTVVHYTSDTEYGSSGAPVFDRQGRLIALHHARQPVAMQLPDGGTTQVVNEGIKIAAIAIDLENRVKAGAPEAGMARAVLAEMRGSDSLTGFFGGLGRPVRGGTGVERVIDSYRGTGSDVDIGFWNIEWLANRYRDGVKLRGAARAIVDLNLDLWGLSEVSPPAVAALVEELRATFGERYEYALSEPQAPESKQSTAVIWKSATLSGRRVAWPAEIEALLRLRSDDPSAPSVEALHGRIFDRYPGLFRFELRGGARRGTPFDFHLVPLHLKAMPEGSLRRRLASRILGRAVRAVISATGDADVILGGDVNAPLASGDFDALVREGGLTALAAEDEAAGSFTYIKGPRSLIDNIFISENLTRTVGATDFFIVAKERKVDDYVRRISDHRPVLVRISLPEPEQADALAAAAAAAARQGGDGEGALDLDALLDGMAAQQRGADDASAAAAVRSRAGHGGGRRHGRAAAAAGSDDGAAEAPGPARASVPRGA